MQQQQSLYQEWSASGFFSGPVVSGRKSTVASIAAVVVVVTIWRDVSYGVLKAPFQCMSVFFGTVRLSPTMQASIPSLPVAACGLRPL